MKDTTPEFRFEAADPVGIIDLGDRVDNLEGRLKTLEEADNNGND